MSGDGGGERRHGKYREHHDAKALRWKSRGSEKQKNGQYGLSRECDGVAYSGPQGLDMETP